MLFTLYLFTIICSSFSLDERIVQYCLIVKSIIEIVTGFKFCLSIVQNYIVFLLTFTFIKSHLTDCKCENYLISLFWSLFNICLFPGTLIFRMDTEIKDIFPVLSHGGKARQVNQQQLYNVIHSVMELKTKCYSEAQGIIDLLILLGMGEPKP